MASDIRKKYKIDTNRNCFIYKIYQRFLALFILALDRETHYSRFKSICFLIITPERQKNKKKFNHVDP